METKVPLQQQHIGTEDASTHLTPQELYQRDPLLVLLRDKWHLNIIWFIIGSFLLFVGEYYGLSALAGLPFTPRSNLVRLLDIFTNVLFYGIYFYLPNSVANLFNTLIDNRVILIDKPLQNQTSSTSPYKVFLDKFISRINARLWLTLALPFIISYPLLRLLGPYISSTPSPFWLRLIGAIDNFSIGYTCVLSIVRISIALFFLYRLLHSFTIRINPLHPDGAGGLGILRQVLWISAGIMLGVASAFYEDSILSSRAVDVALLTAAYIVLIPSLLIGWLILPHRVMLQARKAILQPLTEEYEKVISETRFAASDDTAKIMAGTERLSALTQRYESLRDSFPVWPLEIMQMRQLLIAFILPILIAFISAIPSIPSIIKYFMNNR